VKAKHIEKRGIVKRTRKLVLKVKFAYLYATAMCIALGFVVNEVFENGFTLKAMFIFSVQYFTLGFLIAVLCWLLTEKNYKNELGNNFK